jgi:hypothetical protein
MLTAKDMIRSQFTFGDTLLQSYVGDLSDADLLVRSVPGANHIAWQFGHLIAGTQHILKNLGHETDPLPPGFAEAHAPGNASCDDRKRFSTKAEYLRLHALMLKAMNAALDQTLDTVLEEPGPESMREYAPTKAATFMLLGNHLAMHAAQFVPIRRKLGKPPLF